LKNNDQSSLMSR